MRGRRRDAVHASAGASGRGGRQRLLVRLHARLDEHRVQCGAKPGGMTMSRGTCRGSHDACRGFVHVANSLSLIAEQLGVLDRSGDSTKTLLRWSSSLADKVVKARHAVL